MDTDDFVARHPRLYHLAHADSWPGLQRHGLLSASQLVHLFDAPQTAEGGEVLEQRRPEPVELSHPEHGTAVLRDQRPLNETKLATALAEGMTVQQWLRLLNDLAFFFPTEDGLAGLVKVYGHEPVVVLTVKTSSLVRKHEVWVRLASINTGSVLYKPASRGRETFLSIRRFDKTKRVKEVAVEGGVPDLMNHLWKAERWLPDGTRESLHP